MKKRITVLLVLSVALLSVAFAHRGKPGAPLLRLDVTDTSSEHHVDLPDGTVLEAIAGELGWEFEIHAKPVSDASINLLYNGSILHGIQPWMAFAWTKHWHVYPNVREMEYGSPKRTLRIELLDCETSQSENQVAFAAGEIAVYWHN